jgi:hypothetical protein
VDFALVEVVDIDVVVVIRFVAMDIIPRKRLAQGKPEAKLKIAKEQRQARPENLRALSVTGCASRRRYQASSGDLLTFVKSIAYTRDLF